MKVTHVVPTIAARTGGPAFGTVQLAQALGERGVDVLLIATDQAGPAQLGGRNREFELTLPPEAANIDYELFPVLWPQRLARSPLLRERLNVLAASSDVIHIHGLFLYPAYAAWQACRARHTPFIVSPHGSLTPWVQRHGRVRKQATHLLWQRKMLREATYLHATTFDEAEHWPAYMSGERTVVIPNGIDQAVFRRHPQRRSSFRDRHGIPSNEPVVLSLSRLSRTKNLDSLVAALVRLHHNFGLEAHLVLAGPDDEGLADDLQRIADDGRISGFLHLVGHLGEQDKQDALSACDVFSLPSHSESFGIAAVEALAAGVPTHLSNGVYLSRDLAEDEAALVSDTSACGIADALASILTTPELAGALGHNGRIHAERYRWPNVAEQWCSTYESARSHGRMAYART